MKAPPFLVSYSTIDEYIEALSPESRGQYEEKIRALASKGLPPVVSSRCLATMFGFTTRFVNAMRHQNWKYYRTFSIRKGKKKRTIQAPKVALKVIQKWFGFHLAKTLEFNEFVHGFIEGGSSVNAAGVHSNSKWIFSIDIEDFFQSTTEGVIKSSLLNLGYSQKACDLIVPLCCYKDCLAQGAPSSPVISNLVMKDIDLQLDQVSQKYDVRFSRYADDIVFSGEDNFPELLKAEAKDIFNNTCWTLSESKEYFAELPKRLKVHSLLVDQDKPRLTKGYRNKIRAYKYMLAAEKVKDKDIKRLEGHLNYAKSIDDYEV